MKGFLLSFHSEYYKSRKTLGFWCAIILPVLLCTLITWGVYNKAERLIKLPPMMLWLSYTSIILNIMGSLLLPIYIVFVGYSVNNVEHKADTWKTLFSLPIPKWSVYAAKYFHALFLVFLCLLLFGLLTFIYGHLLGILNPGLHFKDYNAFSLIMQVYFKLFLSSLGILSIQFLLSLLWSDFLKPMGIGFVGTIVGVIATTTKWQFAYLLPYSHPLLAIMSISLSVKKNVPIDVNIFNKEILISLVVAVVVFIAGYFIVERKSVK